MSAIPDFDRLRAAMMAARAQATGRTLSQVQDDIHQERLRILAEDSPPEMGETGEAYVARVVRELGTTYRDAAAEHYGSAAGHEARAEAEARAAIARARGSAAGEF